jgi:tetratricopeptide (TPR) repeat protein
MLGGTLPYMAPEHLDAFRGGSRMVDARSDLYSVGLLLYELLTGRSPYLIGRRGHLTGVRPDLIIEQMIAERKKGPPALRTYNPAITPSAEAIVSRCLEPDPAKRYQTARQLQEDLQRQIDARPLAHVREPSRRERLRKWLHRHPRFLAKVAGVFAVALLAAAAAFGLQALRHARGEQALLALDGFRTDSQAIRAILNAQADNPQQRCRAMELGRTALDRYGVLNDAHWNDRSRVTALPGDERSRLHQEVGDLLLLMARTQAWPVAHSRDNLKAAPQEPLREALALNEQAERCFRGEQAPAALWLQRADLLRQLGDADAAQRLRGKAGEVGPQTAHDYFLMAREHFSAGRTVEAMPLLRRAVELDPRQYWAWFYLGNCNDELGDEVRSVVCYSVCLALDARAFEAYFNRGLAYLRQQNFKAALADFDHGVAQRPELPEPYLNRALARQGLGQFKSAIEDLSTALDKPNAPTRIYFMRARVRARAGDRAGADRDRAEGLRATPADEKSWIARGLARLADDPQGALADFEEALAFNSRSRSALQNKAHVLAEKLNRSDDAVAALDQAVALFPDYLPALVGRGVLHARRGQRDLALADAKQVLERQPSGLVRYQAACIYALTSRSHPADRQEALKLLIESLRQGFGIDLLSQDTDLDPLRQLPEFQRLAAAAEAWQAAIRPMP